MAAGSHTKCSNHKFAVIQNKVQEYKNSLKSKAEELIINGFPDRIVQLNNIIETQSFKNRITKNVYQELAVLLPKSNNCDELPPAKRIRFASDSTSYGNDRCKENNLLIFGPTPVNKHVLEFASVVKPHIKNLIEDSNLLKMWITVLIPKIEDGNNFGVSIQASILGEIQSVETAGASFLEQISKYYIARGKLISKVRKYPHVEDYRHAVRELDEKEYLSLCLTLIEIRNHYCSLHDTILKNYDKIKVPRLTNAAETFC